jgi:hypothetical protein
VFDLLVIQQGRIRHHLHEGEPPTKCHVQERDAPIGSIHRPYDVQVLRDAELIAAVRE